MQRTRRVLALVLFAVSLAAMLVDIAPAGAASRPAQAPVLTADMLSGLQPRNIGPALMSGRFVDIEGVEQDPFVFYAASATGGVFRTINNGVT